MSRVSFGFLAAILLPSLGSCVAQQAGRPIDSTQYAIDAHAADKTAAERQALGFLGYLDNQRFSESWAYTGMLIRTQVDRDSFAAKVQQARGGTGALQERQLIDAAYSTNVPGAPEDGQYVVLHYHASFVNRQDAVETLTLALANGYWRISGYYIK